MRPEDIDTLWARYRNIPAITPGKHGIMSHNEFTHKRIDRVSLSQSSPLSHKRLPKAVWVLLIGGLIVFAVATLKPTPAPVAPTPAAPPSVSILLAEPQTHTLNIQSQGTVSPKREIELIAEVGGRITFGADSFVDGGFVAKDQTLVQIDPRDYELALIQAQARVKDAEQLLATERGRARQAKREWRDLGNSEANDLFLRRPQLASAEAQLQSAQADRDKAKLNLERTRITLPFDGRIRATHVDLGQYVTPGTPIAQVFDTSVAEIRLPLTDRQAALINLPLGTQALVEEQAPRVTINGTIGGTQYQWQGQIVRTDASIDTRSRLFYAVAEVNAPFAASESNPVPLLIGLFVEAHISGRPLDDVIELPKSALFKRNHIYTLDDSNQVHLQRVQLLHSTKDRVWVRGELPAGTPVVLNGQSNLTEGLVVRPGAPLAQLHAKAGG